MNFFSPITIVPSVFLLEELEHDKCLAKIKYSKCIILDRILSDTYLRFMTLLYKHLIRPQNSLCLGKEPSVTFPHHHFNTGDLLCASCAGEASAFIILCPVIQIDLLQRTLHIEFSYCKSLSMSTQSQADLLHQ